MVDTRGKAKVRAYTELLSNHTMLAVLDSPANNSRPRRGVSPAGTASKVLSRNTMVEDPAPYTAEREFVSGRWLDRWEGEGGSWLREHYHPSESYE